MALSCSTDTTPKTAGLWRFDGQFGVQAVVGANAAQAETHCCNACAGLLAVLGGKPNTRAAACRLARACERLLWLLWPSGKGAVGI